MSDLTHDQTTLVIVAIGYIALLGGFAWLMNRRASALIRNIKDKGPEGLWDELGAPKAIQDVVGDPAQRWARFIRSKKYRSRCHPELAAEIDGFRAMATWGLVFLAVTGLGIIYLLWPLIAPKLL